MLITGDREREVCTQQGPLTALPLHTHRRGVGGGVSKNTVSLTATLSKAKGMMFGVLLSLS